MKIEVPKRISAIYFGILSPEEIRRMSVTIIDKTDFYDHEGRGFPGGPLDPRLGSSNNREKCQTCGLRKYDGGIGCTGHFGYIELATPVYHPAFVKHIEKVLNAVCENCGRLKLPNDLREKFWKKMRKFVAERGYANFEIAKKILAKAATVKTCPHCGYVNEGKFMYSKKDNTFIKLVPVPEEEVDAKIEESRKAITERRPEPLAGRRPIVKKKGKKYYQYIYQSPESIRKILSQIYSGELIGIEDEKEVKEREKDVYLIGFHPERALPMWTVLKVLPVPPISVRPPVITADGRRSEDHLTITLRDIIRVNEQLRSKIKGGPSPVIDQLWQRLQKLVSVLYGFHKVGEVSIDNIYVKGILHRLSGKEGRFRHNLSGKRVNYSGRAVISPDPYLSIDEIGVPEKVAKILLFPEVVNEYNIDFLKKLIIRGPENYPGAVYIYKREGDIYKKKSLEVFKDPEDRARFANELKPGDIVERHLIDGDILVFNRQPSLHRISMMAHRVRVLPYNTFRLHLHACPPYNADFDGDEMNVHLPRSLETLAEVETLMAVERHIITARYGGPIIGPKQDFITGAYLLTKPDTKIKKDEAMQVLFYGGIEKLPEDLKLEDEVNGREIFSQFIPPHIYYSANLKPFLCGEDSQKPCRIVIWDGKILDGVIDKNSIGAEKKKNIVQKIVERHGYREARNFLNRISSGILRYLTDRGFSLTLWDISISEEAKKEIGKIIQDYIKRTEELVKEYREGKLRPDPGKTRTDTLEDRIIQTLDEARGKIGDIVVKYSSKESQMVIMTGTGARGDETNLQQVLGVIGQSVVRGKRVRRGFENRTLSYFKWGDIGAKAGGFIINSFSSGMDPAEYFFHNAGGRDSLVDTAVRTADSGYFYRRLVNALQDTRIDYDGTARMMDGYIIQFKFGGDGVHPGKSYAGSVGDFESMIYELVSRRKELGRKAPKSRAWPSYYDKFLERIRENISLATAEELRGILKEVKNKRKLILREDEIEDLYQMIIERYERAQVDPGEAIGTVASQSVSEPATQLTLRTFHWAGVAAYSITTGLPRIKEIFDAVETPSTPLITVYLTSKYNREQRKAQKLQTKLQELRIRSLTVREGGIVFDLLYNRIIVRFDKEKLARYDLTVDKVIEELEKVGKIKIERDPNRKYSIYIYPEEEDLDLSTIKKKIEEKIIRGFKGIERVYIRKTERGEYYLVLQAKDMSPILYIEGVDLTRLATNNIHDMARIFGIEAARMIIMKEAKDVLDQYGLDVDMRHLTFITDLVTHRGKIEAIGRYGVSGKKASVLARAAFEETGKHLFRAAALGVIDRLKGATENVIVGGIAPLGTGAVKLGYIGVNNEKSQGNPKKEE